MPLFVPPRHWLMAKKSGTGHGAVNLKVKDLGGVNIRHINPLVPEIFFCEFFDENLGRIRY